MKSLIVLSLFFPLLAFAQAQDEGYTEPACDALVGTINAKAMAADCRAVSPATRPPCHESNPCSLIVDEVRRGCDFIGKTTEAKITKLCARYKFKEPKK